MISNLSIQRSRSWLSTYENKSSVVAIGTLDAIYIAAAAAAAATEPYTVGNDSTDGKQGVAPRV